MEFLFGLLGTSAPFLAVFTPTLALAYHLIGDQWTSDERVTIILWLNHNRSRQIYEDLITALLDRVSGFLGRREVRVRAASRWSFDQPEDQILARNTLPWSWGLLDFALLMAVAYPILSVIGQWVILGEGRLGTVTFLPLTQWTDRWFPVLLMAGSLCLFGLSATSKALLLRALFIPAAGLWLWFASELAAFAGAGAVAGLFAVALAAAGAFAGAVAGAVGFAFAVAGAGAGAFAVAFAGAGAFAFAGDYVRTKFEQRMTAPSRALLVWMAALFLVLLGVAIWAEPADANRLQEISAVLLFLGFLPLLNATADFASIGLTRLFLRRGAEGHPGRFGLYDLGAGALTFFGLGFAMVGTVALVKAFDGPVLIDLGVLLGSAGTPNAILTDPHAYWWRYVTFLSTLLPTVLHGVIATFAFVAMWPERLRTWIAKGLSSGTALQGRPACLTLSVLIALSVAVPCSILWYGGGFLFSHYPVIGETLIGVFRWFAVLTGAI